MFLKSIVINGFKSFALRRELLIHEGITGIVGPNGSGKSNIADAMRWVLGEQSSRNLRGSNMQEVIFKGTQTRPPKSRCEVSLLFDNSDHHFDVPYSEVVVKRRLLRSGESEYSINGTACRLKDIIALFRDTGLGRDGYSIIGQGRINRILDSRAGERRLVFDEAAGIMKYRSRKEEAERNLQKTRENVDRVSDIVAELESQIGPLEEQVKAAREYRELEEELRRTDVNIVLHSAESQRQKLQSLEQSREEHQRQQQEAAALRDDASQKRLEAKEAAREFKNALAQLEDRQRNLTLQAERAAAQIGLQEQRSQDLERLLADGSEQEERLKARRDEAAARREALLPEIAAMRARQSELRGVLAQIRPARRDDGGPAAALDKVQTRLRELRLNLESRTQAALDDRLGLGAARTELERLEAEGAALDARLETLAAAAAANDQRGEQAMRTVQEMAGRLREIQTQGDTLAEQQRQQAAQSEQIEQRLAASKARLNLIAEMQHGYEGYYDSVRKLFQALEREPGLRSEVYGTVADAVRVDRRYDLALETALGSAMQNVIVTTDEAARELISLLRAQHLGRVTFLPVGTLQIRRLDGREEETVRREGLLGAASDLVQCRDEVRPAIDYLLGRTVVAENLDQALAVKRQRLNSFRLVTLGGDVVVPGGAITGGSSRRPQVSLIGRQRMLEELKKARDGQEAERTKLQNRKVQTAAALAQTKQAGKALEEKLQSVKLELAQCQAESSRLAAAQAEAAEQRQQWQRAHQQAQASRDDRDAASARAEAVLREQRREQDLLEREQIRLEQELQRERADQEVQRRETAALDKELAALNAGLDPKKKAASQAGLDAAQARKELQELEDAQAQRRRELERSAGRCSNLGRQNSEAQEAQQRLADEIERQKRRLKREEENIDFYEQQMNDSDAQEREGSRELFRLDAEMEKCRSQVQMLTDRLWQEHELTWSNAEQLRVEPFSVRAAQSRMQQMREKLREIGAVNQNAVADYERVQERLKTLSAQREDLEAASADLEIVIEELMAAMRAAFTERFAAINDAFSRSFQELFGGGKARLKLEEGVPVMEAGVEIQAEPPGKKLQNITLLSDGEKALTAIALCMAMLEVNPSPICLLDEIDAPLDDKNVVRLSEYLAKMKDKLQFLIITHKKATMSVCDTLYGVAMREKGVTDIVSVAMD